MLHVRPERPEDRSAVEALFDRTFGPDRHRRTSYRYRDGLPPLKELCLVAELDGRPVGAVRFWPVRLDRRPALLLGPLAIEPALHGRGIGRRLVREALARARTRGWRLVFLVGDPPYYRRFGFRPVPPGIVMPGEDPGRLLWRRLGRGGMPRRGVLRRAEAPVAHAGAPAALDAVGGGP